MDDKKIKHWLWAFIATLAITGGISSFFAQKITLYRGNEPLEKVEGAVVKAKAPARNGGGQQSVESTDSSGVKAKTNFIPLKAVAIPVPKDPDQENFCGDKEIPVIAEGSFAGCIKINSGSSEITGEKIPVPK